MLTATIVFVVSVILVIATVLYGSHKTGAHRVKLRASWRSGLEFKVEWDQPPQPQITERGKLAYFRSDEAMIELSSCCNLRVKLSRSGSCSGSTITVMVSKHAGEELGPPRLGPDP